MSIPTKFKTLIDRIQPTSYETDSARQHLGTIRTRLETVFQVSDCKTVGSFNRGTSISGFSDVDLLPVFRKSEFTYGGALINSNTALSNVRQELINRYPSTNIGRDGMAITIAFSDGQVVDVVPALFERLHENRWPVYQIPNGAGGWMFTCPSIYDAYIANANTESGGKLLYVAQLMKFWRACRSPQIPLSSFHIELVLALEGSCKGVKSYAECMRDLLRSLSNRECRAMQDPFQIGGLVPAVKTASQREIAWNSISNSRNHANAAVSAETINSAEARRQWDIVFNKRFPA